MFKQPAIIGLQAAAIALAACCAAGLTHAAEWGDLTGRFVVQGPIPAQVDERLIVDAQGNLANALIYLRTENPNVHPDYDKTATDTVNLEIKNDHFEPHMLVIRTNQQLQIKNGDAHAHDAKCDFLNPSNSRVRFQELLQTNGVAKEVFLGEERLPVQINSTIRAGMSCYLLVRSNPYGVVSDKDGKFTIKNLPAGQELEFQLWQEKLGYLKNAITFQGGKVDEKGRFKITLKPGANDLGDIGIPGAAIAKAK